MALSVGTRLGHFEIETLLGAGGMGEVYRARDARLDRTVAVKVLAPELATDPAFRTRFEREAKALSALTHPHICRLYDLARDDQIEYLVLELLEGETLAARLERGPLPLRQVLSFGVEIADALEVAHRQGIVHRDLKPANVMITPGGTKLLDFGLAKNTGGAGGQPLSQLATAPGTATAQGTIIGTLQYMAPEQVQGQPVDARTDIFALGAVLYEMVAGRKAFEAKTQASLIAKILETDPPALSTVVPIAPRALDRLVQRCLAKNPDDRWQSARDVLLELRWIQEDGDKPGTASPPPARRRQWLAWAAAMTTALVAALMWSLRPARSDVNQPPSARFDVALPPKISPLAEFQGSPSLSPDGRYLAIAASVEGRQQLLLRRLDDTAFVPVPGTDDARVPFWSPDSRSVAFFASGKLRRIAVTGGPAVTICHAGDVGYGGSWNEVGGIVFAMGGVIYRVAESGGAPVAVSFLDTTRGDVEHRDPYFLPDGQSFLFTVLGREPGIHAGVLGTQTTKLVVRDGRQGVFVPPSSLIFVREQSVMAVPFDTRRLVVTGRERKVADQTLGGLSATRTGTVVFRPAGVSITQLQWLARDGRRLAVVAAAGLGPYQQLDLSPSGKRVALQQGEVGTVVVGGADIWMIDLTTNVKSRVTSDPGFDGDPSWSPDERSLAFTTRRNGRLSLFKTDLSGNETPLANLSFPAILDDWTPDGRFVIFRNLGRAIQALPLAGDHTPRVIVDTPLAIEDQAHVSPDGRWIAFNSNESGRWEVYVASFPDFLGKRQSRPTAASSLCGGATAGNCSTSTRAGSSWWSRSAPGHLLNSESRVHSSRRGSTPRLMSVNTVSISTDNGSCSSSRSDPRPLRSRSSSIGSLIRSEIDLRACYLVWGSLLRRCWTFREYV